MAKFLAFILSFVLLSSSAFASLPVGGKWFIVLDKSRLTFTAKQTGADFTGRFGLYNADINFDPEHMDKAHIAAHINTNSVDTSSPERDDSLRGAEWFNVTAFPEARFDSTAIRVLGNNKYEADGLLTIRDISIPITLPFTLIITSRQSDNAHFAVADAEVTLDRSRFKLGGDKWKDTSVIANEVLVKLHLEARMDPPNVPKH